MNLHLTVTVEEAEIIGKALQQMPFGMVQGLFAKLQQQIHPQQKQPAEAQAGPIEHLDLPPQ